MSLLSHVQVKRFAHEELKAKEGTSREDSTPEQPSVSDAGEGTTATQPCKELQV